MSRFPVGSLLARRLAVAALVAAVAGCGGDKDSVAPQPSVEVSTSATPTASPTPASVTIDAGDAARWDEVRSALPIEGGLEITGETVGPQSQGRFTVRADIRSGRFEADVSNPAQSLKIIFRDQTAWVMADAAYWVSTGYTQESAQAAVGKWVLMDQLGSEQLSRQYGPGSVLRPLAKVPATDLVASRRTSRAGTPVLELDYVQDGVTRTVVVTAAGDPLVVEVIGKGNGVTATTRLRTIAEGVQVQVPDADNVVGVS